MALTTADLVRSELQVSATEYPSSEDTGVTETTLLDRWIRRANRLVERRIPSSEPTTHREDLATLVAAHFGYADKTGGTDGRALSSISSSDRTVNFDMNDVTGDDGFLSTPYGVQAVELDSRINDDEVGHFTLSTG